MSIRLQAVTAPADRRAQRCAIIGLSTSEMRDPERIRHDPHSEPAGRELALNLTYPDAIRRAGAVPVVIPPMDEAAIEPLLDGLWGLCLSGGPDLMPSCYGAEPDPALGHTEPHLDIFEIALVRAAEARDMPVLAICRGQQVLNVIMGGTLWQDIPSQYPTDFDHRESYKRKIRDFLAHEVRIAPATRLSALVGADRVGVNTSHHQAVRLVAPDLKATAWAPDDVIEGLESEVHNFVVTVQWHPEEMVRKHEWTRRLFAALVDAATGRKHGSGDVAALARSIAA